MERILYIILINDCVILYLVNGGLKEKGPTNPSKEFVFQFNDVTVTGDSDVNLENGCGKQDQQCGPTGFSFVSIPSCAPRHQCARRTENERSRLRPFPVIHSYKYLKPPLLPWKNCRTCQSTTIFVRDCRRKSYKISLSRGGCVILILHHHGIPRFNEETPP